MMNFPLKGALRQVLRKLRIDFRPRPHMICVGAEKCATSFLYTLLRDHPLVFVSKKDNGAYHRLVKHRNIVEYLDVYLEGIGEESVLCDFQATMMLDPATPKAIARVVGKKTKILFMMRDPVKRMYSEYRMRVSNGHEDLPFEEALEAEPGREAKNHLRWFHLQAYEARSRYAEQISNFLKVFPKEQLGYVIFEEDIEKNLPATVDYLARFLGISPEPLQAVVANYESRPLGAAPKGIDVVFEFADGQATHIDDLDSARTDQVLQDPKALNAIRFLKGDGTTLIREIKSPGKHAVETALVAKANYDRPLETDQKKRLFNERFADDVAALEKMIGRDLSCWK